MQKAVAATASPSRETERAGREEAQQEELGRGRDARPRRRHGAACSERRRPTATPTSTTASRTNATGLAARVSSVSAAPRPAAPGLEREKASRASATPSANGNSPARITPGPDHREAAARPACGGPHSRSSSGANAPAATATVSTASSSIPSSAASG